MSPLNSSMFCLHYLRCALIGQFILGSPILALSVCVGVSVSLSIFLSETKLQQSVVNNGRKTTNGGCNNHFYYLVLILLVQVSDKVNLT